MSHFLVAILLNDTMEERVSILEIQMETINSDVGNLESDLEAVENEVTIISTEQIIQDERLLELEVDSDGMKTYLFCRKLYWTSVLNCMRY